jgi:hypothetical protein
MNKLCSPFVILVALSTVGFSQSVRPCDASKGVRIEKDKPGVYVSFERFGKAVNPLDTRLVEPSNSAKSKEKGDDVWLRLHNNTCWPIQIETLSGYLPKERKPDEKLIDYLHRGYHLENDVEISIAYEVEEYSGERLRSFIDSFSLEELPPGVSVLFSVAREHLSSAKKRSIYVSYTYSWELDERGFPRPDEPEHRVEYSSYRLEGESKK